MPPLTHEVYGVLEMCLCIFRADQDSPDIWTVCICLRLPRRQEKARETGEVVRLQRWDKEDLDLAELKFLVICDSLESIRATEQVSLLFLVLHLEHETCAQVTIVRV
jgi:hypothetical protein